MHRHFAAGTLVLALFLVPSCARKESQAPPRDEVASHSEAEARQFDQLTIREIMQGPGLVGTPPSNPRFSANGRFVYFDWNSPARLDSLNAIHPDSAYENHWNLKVDAGIWRLDVASRAMVKLSDAEADTTVPTASAWDRGRQRCVETRGGDLWLVDLKAGNERRVTATADSERFPQISADGRTVYFARGNNLYAMPFDGGTIRQLTQVESANAPSADKPKPQRKHVSDEEKKLFVEFKDRGDKEITEARAVVRPKKVYVGAGFSVTDVRVSPSGRFVAYDLQKDLDDFRKPVIPIVPAESGYTETEDVRAYVGEFEQQARIAFVDTEADSLIWYDAEATTQLDAMAWSPTEDLLLVKEIPVSNQDRNFVLASPAQKRPDGKASARVVDRFHDAAWVDGPGFDTTGDWLPDGSGIYFISETTGWGHLYTVTKEGRHRQLTDGAFEVYSARYDEARKRWLITSNEGRPGSTRIWTLDEDGRNRRVMVETPGTYEVTWSPDLTVGAVLYASAVAPAELHVLDTTTAKFDGPLTQSTTKAFRAYKWLEPETTTFRADDGVDVFTHVFRPERFGAKPNGAGVIFIHGAGYLQNVLDGWQYYYREYMFNCMLAAHGYTVLNIDYRGSAGYGRDCRTAIYKHMGGRDLGDIIDGARFLKREYGVGDKQVGTYGGSYGGFLTLMALFKYPNEIASGAALRSVTDWAHYNHGYTVRILGTPEKDPEAYRRSSPIYFAEGFAGNLEMLHGLRDDNVLAEDVIRLSQRLIELEKQNWNLTLHPVERHGYVRASSWTDQMTRAFKLFERTLPAAPAP